MSGIVSLRSLFLHSFKSESTTRILSISNYRWTNFALQINPALTYGLTWGNIGGKLDGWLNDLKECILRAVPKKKTTYGKKRRRAAGKSLKNLNNIGNCQSCGQSKLMHHLCQNCYREFRNRIKEDKEQVS
ncbi:hypothetical protein DSO57_1035933 [Entomophthora muscae]|uniref:Uncharacterized protein n=1 Tax=Entomophthora muscae TaxID=34485 RepID=A0ACC2SC37_9FUNG|nr:hypothetical protein DSO57_1035933 [Entomophthora muscae]